MGCTTTNEDQTSTRAGADIDDQDWHATRAWVERNLHDGERIDGAERLRGGWTSHMRRLHITGPAGERSLVLRSFVTPFFLRHAEALLTREAGILRLLDDTGIPAPALHAVDSTSQHCTHPSLLMTLLPGGVLLTDEDSRRRADLLARQLVGIHRLEVAEDARPRTYEAWTSPERVRLPEHSRRPDSWRRAVDVIRRDPPQYEGCFLHRDFHPGNVLFTFDGGSTPRISGVVDWVETSWGPADLDVAHCSTALALLHSPEAGMHFADRYLAAGGRLAADTAAHLYWRVLDALSYAPDAEKVAGPWRELGRTDLTPTLLTRRLEEYVRQLFERFG